MPSLSHLWITNGLNILSPDKPTALPPQISQIFYKTTFLANFNFDIILMLAPLVVGGTMLLLGKLLDSDRGIRWGRLTLS